jgi:hypothetical protein
MNALAQNPFFWGALIAGLLVLYVLPSMIGAIRKVEGPRLAHRRQLDPHGDRVAGRHGPCLGTAQPRLGGLSKYLLLLLTGTGPALVTTSKVGGMDWACWPNRKRSA